MPRLHALDLLVIAVYGLVVVAIGVWANRRQKDTEDYFLGGRKMRWWAVGISLIATSFSSAALIGGTGEGFENGLGYLQLQVGDFLAIALAVFLFLPFYARLRLTTAYGYLEARFGVGARTVASALFIGQTVMRAGILVLAPALAISAVFGWDVRWGIVVSGAAAVLYSAAGGLMAVVWTDMIQLAVVVFAVVFSLVLVSGDVPGGLGAIVQHATETGRLAIGSADMDLAKPYTLPWTLLAYGTLALSIAGTNQQAVQRYMACEDVRSARRAAFLGWGIGFVAVGLTLVLGAALHAWSVLAPGGDALVGTADKVLPTFVLLRLPAGLAGLVVAAIFAASMSSMDSAIHSMSTATIVDFVRRFRREPMAPGRELRLARILTVVFGVLATGLAVFAAAAQTPLLRTLFTWLGYFAGPLLGLFVLGVLSRRATEAGALIGVGAGAALVLLGVALGLAPALGVHPLWFAPLALIVTVVVGWLSSLAFPGPPPSKLDGLTWSRRLTTLRSRSAPR